jgi:hypothetical protein
MIMIPKLSEAQGLGRGSRIHTRIVKAASEDANKVKTMNRDNETEYIVKVFITLLLLGGGRSTGERVTCISNWWQSFSTEN